MDIEKFILDSAARGLSRTATAAALGMRFEKFRGLLAAMPPLKWPAPGQSLDERRSREALRGNGGHPAHRLNLEKARTAARQAHIRTVRGVTGTIPELVEHFKLSIHVSTVQRRLRLGQRLDDALFTPARPPASRRRMKITPSPPVRPPLSAWEAVDLESAGQAPQCM